MRLLMLPAIAMVLAGHALAGAGSPQTCVVVEGDRILARDLARVVAVFGALEPDLPLAPGPAPGVRRIVNASELRLLARRHQLPDPSSDSICFEQPMEPLTEARVLKALRKALGEIDGSIEIVDFSRFPVPRGELEFQVARLGMRSQADVPVLWRGLFRYGQRRSLPVWARVRIKSRRRQLVAVRNLPAGKPIATQDLAEEITQGFPTLEGPLQSLQDAAGAVPRRTIRRGEALLASMLRAPNEVQRGDLVSVEVHSGSTHLEFEARAETAAPRGAPVLVKNPSTGKRFTATVQSTRKVVVHTGHQR
jgi:flagella basal body P-ring formation protein FlgA